MYHVKINKVKFLSLVKILLTMTPIKDKEELNYEMDELIPYT